MLLNDCDFIFLFVKSKDFMLVSGKKGPVSKGIRGNKLLLMCFEAVVSSPDNSPLALLPQKNKQVPWQLKQPRCFVLCGSDKSHGKTLKRLQFRQAQMTISHQHIRIYKHTHTHCSSHCWQKPTGRTEQQNRTDRPHIEITSSAMMGYKIHRKEKRNYSSLTHRETKLGFPGSRPTPNVLSLSSETRWHIISATNRKQNESWKCFAGVTKRSQFSQPIQPLWMTYSLIFLH